MPANEEKIRVFIIDDHPMVCDGLSTYLNLKPDMTTVGMATSGEMAINKLAATPADVLILDLTLQSENGMALIKRLIQAFPEARVLVLTMHKNQELVAQALSLGASGYLLKEDSAEEVIQGIRSVYAGKEYITPRLSSSNSKESRAKNKQKDSEILAGQVLMLTSREQEILHCLGLGMRSAAIAEKLCISIKTVNAHRQNIRSKLGLKDYAELMAFAARAGKP